MTTEINFENLLRTGDEDDEPKFTHSWRREPNFLLKDDGDTAILRFVTESKDWKRGLTHRYVEVGKPQPEGYEGKWPKGLSATCRKDPGLKTLYPNACPICLSPQTSKYGKNMEESTQDLRFALAVEREEVLGDGSLEMGGPENLGKKGYRDRMVDVPVWDESGNAIKDRSVKRPSLVIVSGTMYQMFSSLKGLSDVYGTLRDRDFRAKKYPNPNGKGSLIQWVPLDKIDTILPGTEAWQSYEDSVQAWVPGGLNLARMIGEKSADPFYERFFTTNGQLVIPSKGSPASAGGGFSVPSAASAGQVPDQDKLAEMRARIQQQSGGPSAPSAA